MYCYDSWLLLSCCAVQPLVCLHGQVSDIQDSQVAHQIRNSKCQVARGDNTCQAAFECLVFSDIYCTPDSHSRLLGVQLIYRRCGTYSFLVTNLAIVRCNTAKSNVWTCVK